MTTQSNFDLQTQSSRSVINKINDFLATPHYVALLAVLTAASNLFALELPYYTLIAALCLYVCIFGRDLLPLAPYFAFCYMSPSIGNNPGQNQDSIFSAPGTRVYILCLGAILALSVLYRIIRCRKQFFRKNALFSGMVVLGCAYLVGGLGSAAFPNMLAKNTLFALMQCGAVILPYWLLCGGVDWKTARRDYLAWIGFSAGGILLFEILGIYLQNNVIIDGTIYRDYIYTGWGIHNNLGGMLAMMIPFAFFLATKYHKGWIGTVVGSAFYIGVLLTCSRSSILVGSIIYLVCITLMLHYARNRRHNTIALITVIGTIILALVLFHKQLLVLFSDLLDMGMDPSSRDTIYMEGLESFMQAPLFGNSFYSPGFVPWDWSTVDSFSGFFPPRWHNTLVQLLASCGIFGIGAYLHHRIETVRLFFRHACKETVFISCSLGVLLLCSLFDCHFFNIGPVLFYSAALAFTENCFNNR